jgi:DNA mismatch repair protein MutS
LPVNERTPMMRQYLQIKGQYPDAILFFRLGDFYEMFFEDAEVASRELDLTLTSRNKNSPDKVPLCGIPYHAASGYISRLISKGYKVAICDQVEDPRQAKGIVRREVTRVVTPGLVLDAENLEADHNNFLLCLAPPDPQEGSRYGLAYVDISTGDFRISETEDFSTVEDEILRIDAREVLLPDNLDREKTLEPIYDGGRQPPLWNPWASSNFSFDSACAMLERQFGPERIQQMITDGSRKALCAAGALLGYLQETQKQLPGHLHGITRYEIQDFMILDDSALRNLEIVQTWMDRSKKNSLLGVLDLTQTAMGARLLRRWVQYPLLQAAGIQRRLDVVEELTAHEIERAALRDTLKEVQDLERLNSRICLGIGNPRDLVGLRESLGRLPKIHGRLEALGAEALQDIRRRIDPMEDVVALLDGALQDEPPVTVREGGIFREGYSAELDDLKAASRDGKRWIAALEAEERERTGIGSLKVRYNRVFGYYIEVTKANLASVPEDYDRKQTLANAERFTTPALKEYEQKVVGAEDRAQNLEYDLFQEIRTRVAEQSLRVRTTAQSVAELDVFTCLAEVAVRNNYTRPEISLTDELVVWEGRHPVIEQMPLEERFVPNDAYMDGQNNRMVIITGPNMAGKSTYMRQLALIVLMAQMGSFVPAGSARVGLVDRIFTRVGAMDNLVRGQSTFMVEMKEAAHILDKATPRSLILLDEVGRGTSTFDGVSIAWAIAEFIDHEVRARTLFATHYHELAELAALYPTIKNCHVSVKEWGENILFLRKVMEGSSSHSYGIQVARLAGVPAHVIRRAREILENLESGQWDDAGQPRLAPSRKARGQHEEEQPSLFPAAHPITEDILGLNLHDMTPLEALNKLQELQDRLLKKG